MIEFVSKTPGIKRWGKLILCGKVLGFLQSTLKINISGIMGILFFPSLFNEVIQIVIPESKKAEGGREFSLTEFVKCVMHKLERA